MRLTVGPLPPAVYWRRRVLVLGAALLALFLVAQACMAASASSERSGAPPTTQPPAPTTQPPTQAPTGQPTFAPTQPATQTPTAAPATGQPPTQPAGEDVCTDDEMRIVALSDLTEFRAGASVQFTIRIRNGGDRTCERDIGGSQRELFLRRGSGADRVWSSRDCHAPTGAEVLSLRPAFEREHWTVWNGRASNRCDGGDPTGDLVAPGNYELVARLGTDYSEPVPITVIQ
jgi:hypothetical protein